jgi:hypothetical protein
MLRLDQQLNSMNRAKSKKVQGTFPSPLRRFAAIKE